jgi:hypothetical protein
MGRELDPEGLGELDPDSEQAINVLDDAEAEDEEIDADQLAELGIEPELAIKGVLDEAKAEDVEANENGHDYEDPEPSG